MLCKVAEEAEPLQFAIRGHVNVTSLQCNDPPVEHSQPVHAQTAGQ